MQQWDQELKTAVPVAEEQHHANEVKNSHHSAGKVIGHVENLLTKVKSILTINFLKVKNTTKVSRLSVLDLYTNSII